MCVAVVPALLVSGVGQAMALVGASINPVIGFILPVIFYWKTIEKLPIMSTEKLLCIFTVIVISICSVLGLVQFFTEAAGGGSDNNIYSCKVPGN